MQIKPLQYCNISICSINSKNNFAGLNSSKKSVPIESNYFNTLSGISGVSFCGVIHPQSENLKKLLKYRIPDIYSDIILISPSDYERLMKTKTYEKPIGSLVKVISQYESSLVPSEKEFLNILRTAANRQPKKNLEQVVHDLFLEHNSILMKNQQGIIEKLKLLARQMPEIQQEQFEEFIAFFVSKIERRPVVQKFNVKEFKYKLSRITEWIKNKNDKEELRDIREIVKMSNRLPTSPLTALEISMNEKSKRRKFLRQKRKNTEQIQLNILAKMDNYMDNSSLKNNRELRLLLANSRSMIYKLPIVYPFNRKTFIYELEKITRTLEDKKLARKMILEAIKLPTSKNSVSAFIVKSALSSSEKIFQDLFSGARGTIEHIIPSVKNGKDYLTNYALASAWMNNERAHRSFAEQLRKYPEIYRTAQNHVDRLIELYNNGIFEKAGMTRGYIINLVELLHRLSPPEKPLELDISKLNP